MATTARFFTNFQGEKYVDGWANIWNIGEFRIWDKECPNPALEDALARRELFGDPIATDPRGYLYRKKALVPGCGRGVDVLLLASFGYDAYGLECSAVAVEACNQEKLKNRNRYPIRDPMAGWGNATFIQGDFFKDDWLEEMHLSRNCFDLIYDYRVSGIQCKMLIISYKDIYQKVKCSLVFERARRSSTNGWGRRIDNDLCEYSFSAH